MGGEKSSLIPTEVGVRMVEAHSQARILPRLTGQLPIFAGRWLSLLSKAAFANARSSNCLMPSALRNLYPCSSKPTALSRMRSQLDITNIIKMEFDCRPGAIAMSLSLREPKYQETAAYCHFGREAYTKDGIKFFEWENAKDLSKYT